MKKITLLILLALGMGISFYAQDKKYKGAELYSIGDNVYLYGKIEMRMKMVKGSGILSTFFTYKGGSEQPGTFWEEIDIEVFGKDEAKSWQSNVITDVPGSNNVEEVHRTSGYSLADDYHTYTLEWRPESVVWKLDGELIRIVTGEKAKDLTNPQSFRFNLWAANIEEWVGPFQPKVLPVHQYVNWIKYYTWSETGFSEEPEWEDHFDYLDTSRWGLADWTFDQNLVDFDPNNVTVKDGYLVLSLTKANKTGYTGTPPVDKEQDVASTASDVASVASEVPVVATKPKSKVPTAKPKVAKPTAAKTTKPPTTKVNETSNEVYLSSVGKILIVTIPLNDKSPKVENGAGMQVKKIKNYRNGESIDISFLSPGSYYLVTKEKRYGFEIK